MILLVVLGGVCSCSRNQGPQQIESSEATPTENVTDTPPTRTPPLPAAPSSMAPVETPPVSTPPATPTTTETSTFPSSAAPVSHSSPTTVQETPRPESERVVLPGSIPGEVTVSNPPPAPPVIPETTSTTTTPPTVIFSLPVIGPSPPIPPSPDSGGSRVVGGGPLTDSTRLNLNLDNLGKKLIWFSPAFPTTQYIANHQNELDQLPVDGLVFDVLLNRSLSLMTAPFRYGPDNTLGRLLFAHTPNVLGSVVRFDPSDPNLTMAVSEMAEEKNSGRHNFLSVATGFKEGYYRSATALSLRPPAWNDDVGWANATANWELAARIAKQTGAKGLMLDFEPYGDESSEPELSEVCGSKGRRFRFSIPLTPFAATFAHKEIVVIPADSFGLGTMSLAGRLIQPAIVETGAGRPSLPVWSEIRSLADRPINLLSNPGFETDGFWQSTLLSAPGSATAEILSTDRYNGLRSAQLNFLVPESSARWHQNFLVPGQKTLGLKIHYKTSADFTGSAQAGLVTEETTYRLSLSPTGGVWQQAELGNIVINAPGMRSVELLLNGMGRGKVIFDSLELSKVEDGVMSPVSLVADAGFEHGSPLWQTHSASGEYYFLIDREVSRTGRYAARITTSSSESVKGQGSQGRWYQKSVSVVRGHRYHLSIAVKTSGSEDPFPPFSGLIGVWVRCDEGVLGACNRNYSLSPTGGEWRTLSGDFIPSTDTVDIYLNSFGENTGGSVWFDDITISE